MIVAKVVERSSLDLVIQIRKGTPYQTVVNDCTIDFSIHHRSRICNIATGRRVTMQSCEYGANIDGSDSHNDGRV
jgi:hypothetical protein